MTSAAHRSPNRSGVKRLKLQGPALPGVLNGHADQLGRVRAAKFNDLRRPTNISRCTSAETHGRAFDVAFGASTVQSARMAAVVGRERHHHRHS